MWENLKYSVQWRYRRLALVGLTLTRRGSLIKCNEIVHLLVRPCVTLYVGFVLCVPRLFHVPFFFCIFPFMYSMSLSVSVLNLLPPGEHPLAAKWFNSIQFFNSILYYLCAKSTASRPITEAAQCIYYHDSVGTNNYITEKEKHKIKSNNAIFEISKWKKHFFSTFSNKG
jgi:hypothetical protein